MDKLYFRGEIEVILKDEFGNIKDTFKEKNTWTKNGIYFTCSTNMNADLYLITESPFVTPYANAESDFYIYLGNKGSIPIDTHLGYNKTIQGYNPLYYSGVVGPSSTFADTYIGVYFYLGEMSAYGFWDRNGTNDPNEYNKQPAFISSIIRFPRSLIMSASDTLTWTYYVYITNSKML